MPFGTIFRELKFPSGLRVRNRIFPSNVSGRFDNYNGTGTQTRINWEVKFACGGVCARHRRTMRAARGQQANLCKGPLGLVAMV
ncbi:MULTISPECIES: hypothetical protein [Myxococcus]|uniref:hypothetical protein n=1 Tax=Myxococcus TaxID=32 RepID=UPI001891A4DE|nr:MULTISPECIES: hypothetical protein [Myxococcus]